MSLLELLQYNRYLLLINSRFQISKFWRKRNFIDPFFCNFFQNLKSIFKFQTKFPFLIFLKLKLYPGKEKEKKSLHPINSIPISIKPISNNKKQSILWQFHTSNIFQKNRRKRKLSNTTNRIQCNKVKPTPTMRDKVRFNDVCVNALIIRLRFAPLVCKIHASQPSMTVHRSCTHACAYVHACSTQTTFDSSLTYADAIDTRDGRDDCAMDGSG